MTGLALAMPSRRAGRMVQRSLLVYKHTYMVIVSGFFEPVFYFLGIGLGVGGMVPDIDGVSYAAFVVPGLLASSCMNGAISDGMFNIFFKLRYQKVYDGILSTPMRVPDIACGEVLWAVIRSSVYSAAFLVVVIVMEQAVGEDLLLSPWAAVALPGAIFVSIALCAMALCVTSFVRKIQDFDIVMGLLVMPMFLFSGIFFPVSQFPQPVQWIVSAFPLYHAVELLRQLTTGTVGPAIAVHITYLAAVGTIAFFVAMQRLERALVK
jgi:lipooligosaccharide transport system permease protein